MAWVSSFTEEVAATICKLHGDGQTLSSICRMEGMPARSTLYDWMDADEDFAGRIARARARGIDAIGEECIEISEDREDDAHSRRVRIDTRLKLLAKWDPKRYGDKLELSGDKDRPLNVNIKKFSAG